MIFAWKDVGVFFAAMLLVGWLLYPSEYFQGRMHMQEGNRSVSIAFLKDFLAGHPFHKGATLALADAYEAAGRPEEAVRLLTDFYRHRRGDAESGLKALEFMERSGEASRAGAFRWELFEDLRGRPDVDKLVLEQMMYRAFQEAAAAQDDAGVVRALRALVRIGGGSGGYWDTLVRHFVARGNLSTAASLIRQQVAQQPRDLEARRALIRIERLRGDDAAALSEIGAGLRILPDNAGLLEERVALRQSKKRPDLEIDDLRRLAAIQPEDAAWPRELAQCLVRSGRAAEGVAILQSLLERKPADKERWWSLIYFYSDRKNSTEAARWLERFAQRFPDDEQGLEMLLYQYEISGRNDRAVALLRRRLARHPGDARRRRALAGLLTQEERFDEAAAEYRALVRASPDDRELRRSLIYVYQVQHDRRKAAAELERFLARFPDDAKARDELVSTYLALGDKKTAILLLQRYFGAGAGPAPTSGGAHGR